MKVVALDDVCESIVDGPFGSNLKTSDYQETGVPVLQGKNITGNSFVWKEVRYISEQKAEELSRSSALVGDHLVIKIGSIGYSAILDHLNGHQRAIIPANLARLRARQDIVDDQYLHHWLISPEAKAYFVKVASKTAQPALSLKKIREAPIPLPPLEEQKRIAGILDQAAELCRLRTRALDKLNTLGQAIFHEMFGDPATNPKGWPSLKIRDAVAKISDGPFGSNLKSSHYKETGVRVWRLQNIGVGEVKDEDQAFVSAEHFATLTKHKCLPGDVIVGTLGDPNLRACIQPDWMPEALNKADCVQIRPDDNIALGEFWVSLLNHPSTLSLAQSSVLGQTRARISMGRLREIEVPVPPVSLQGQFRDQLRHVDKLKGKLLGQIDYQRNLFTSLQHRAFRGGLGDV